MNNRMNLLDMFRGLTRSDAVSLAERLRAVAAATADDKQLAAAVQAEFEDFKPKGIQMDDIQQIQQQQSEYQQKMLNPAGEYVSGKWVSADEKREFIQGWNRAQEINGQTQQQPTGEQIKRELAGLMDQARELRRDPVGNRKQLKEIDEKLARTTATLGQIRSQEAQPARQEAQQAHQGKVNTLQDEARTLARDPVSNQQRIRQINAELKKMDKEQP